MLLQKAGFSSFLRLNNILLYILCAYFLIDFCYISYKPFNSFSEMIKRYLIGNNISKNYRKDITNE